MGKFLLTLCTSLKNRKAAAARWRDLSGRWEHFAQRKSFGQQDIRYDRYQLSAKDWCVYSAWGCLICGLVCYTFYRSFVLFLAVLPAGLLLPLFMKGKLARKRLHTLKLEFKEGIMVLSSFLSAGYSVENAFQHASKELLLLYDERSLIVCEFAGITKKLRMNQTAEVVLGDFADRSGLDDIRNFSEVFKAAKRGGGDLASVINHTAQVIHDKTQVQEEILTLTASRRLEQRIMNLIPFLLVFYIDTTSPGFFDPVYHTVFGRILMTVCLIVYAAAYLAAEKILEIEI